MIEDGFYWFTEQESNECEVIWISDGAAYRHGTDISFYVDGMKPEIFRHHLKGTLGKKLSFEQEN